MILLGTVSGKNVQLRIGAAEESLVVGSSRHATSPGSALPGPRFERRIGRRHAVSLVHLTWRPRLAPKWFRRSTRSQRATVIDLSVTGARIRAPANAEIQRGTMVTIAFGPHRGLVQVRRIERARDPTVAYYGVRFVSLDTALRQLVDDAVGADRPTEADWR